MEVNTNFLAASGWGLANTGGNAITLQIAPTFNTSDGGTKTYLGWGDIIINPAVAAAQSNDDGLMGVTPSVEFTPRVIGGAGTAVGGVSFFRNFLQKNTAHVVKMNVRASAATVLPTSIVILSPNMWTGQLDRQVVNVTADTTMYQQQDNIVTITGLDVYIGRMSIIRFEGAFSESATPTLNIDVTIDRYISVEKALAENIENLNTATGAVKDLENVVNASAARVSPDRVKAPATDQAFTAIRTGIDLSRVPSKGFNSMANR